jgi:Tfp pilus assembly protein PilF
MPTVSQALTLGLEHYRAGRLDRAESIYRQVLKQHPGNDNALHLLGVLLIHAGRRDEAIPLLEQAVAARPENPVYLGNLGSAYLTTDQFAEARATLEKAVRCDPAHADAHYHLGIVFERFAWLDVAVASYRRAIELRPKHAAARNNLGNVLFVQGKRVESLAQFEAVLADDPQSVHAHYNRALALLALGRLAEGWEEYDWRWRCHQRVTPHSDEPTWTGEPLCDQTLLVRAEQGLGDTIQFLRYLPLVRQRVRRVLVEVPASLLPLLRVSGVEGLVAQAALCDPPRSAALPPFDLQVSLVSLPRIFRTALETIPAGVPYLKADVDLVARWRDKLSGPPGLKVGIAWQGSPSYRDDRFRSIPLVCFAPLAAVPGVRLFSVQKGAGAEQIRAPQGRFGAVDLESQIDQAAGPFMDTAAIMKNLDLVITSDTAIAHLAGALGVTTWIALCAGPDWRWLAERRDSPWYPSVRLFRQARLGDWRPVFQEMARELGAFTARNPSPGP